MNLGKMIIEEERGLSLSQEGLQKIFYMRLNSLSSL